ncbi:MAG: response regulator transcription factor [Saprospiraceae bacterium]|nr:MAG: response regulator transcription factor [Saprospiraceae bacterium]
MKILLIEDEPELAKSILAYLSDLEFACDWADGIAKALDLLRRDFGEVQFW